VKLVEALRDIDARLLQTREGRIAVTKHDPLLFAAVYMPHKLKVNDDDTITLNDFHLDVINYAKSWTYPLTTARGPVDTFIAPRMTGKSTWIFHILPIWAASHMHKRYIIAFSDSDTQARQWLLNFKMEITGNKLLAEDYPELVETAKMTEGAKAMMDNRNVTKRGNGFIFQVAGADSNVLGANIGGLRPEILLFDDIEPTESNYSQLEAAKRLNTVLSAHFYLNTYAIKVFIGTTTMPDSIIDQIRKVGEAKANFTREQEWDREAFRNSLDSQYRWVVDHEINCRYWPAIISSEAGEYSLWPEKWPMEWLNNQRHTREFAMNMMNRPISLDGGYWGEDDILIDEPIAWGNTIISVDPAVTTKRASDYTGIAVLSRGIGVPRDWIYVRHAEQVKYTSVTLKDHIDSLIEKYDAKVVYVETNQGGDLWKDVFSGIKAKFRSVRQSEKKELRAAKVHDLYIKGRVKHTKHFPSLEEQMLAFPKVPHDDVLDAVVSGVLYFNRPSGNTSITQTNYLENN
jgi:predicted phage terminase large subunit-like protein